MRAPDRTPMPNLDLLLDEINQLLVANELPICHQVEPVSDGDTANPNVIAHSTELNYVVKVTQRHPNTLEQQLKLANALLDASNLPIPRHYCCGRTPSNLPLMIMEWLPGEQLRVVLGRSDRNGVKSLCRNLAECIAEFHEPQYLALVPATEYAFPKWLYTRTLNILEDSHPNSLLDKSHAIDVASVRDYLDARVDATSSVVIPSLEKADLDLRDFLVDPTSLRLTGMLDWERISRGDGIYAIMLFYFRLWLTGNLHGWTDFLSRYNELATPKAEECPHAEFYLMCRSILALRFNDRAAELIDLLLHDRVRPFDLV